MKDRELTMRKLIDAVGNIIRTRGFSDVRISKVAREAGVDRKLVYRYFGNLNNLTEAYILENDYWLLFADRLKRLSQESDNESSQTLITQVLRELFEFFVKQPEMQHLLLMELSGTTSVMRSIHNVRESIGQQILEVTDDHFKNSEVNFRAVSALLVGGIYYIILHTRKNGHRFADLDLGSKEGIDALMVTVEQVVDWAYRSAQ